MRTSLLLIMIMVLLVAGCSGDDDDDEENSVDLDPSPTAAPSPEPTNTPTPEPTETPVPTPTPTPTPTSTPTPTPVPTPTPEPERSTLTGEPVEEPAPRPVAVRIDNSPNARPHSGVAQADIVYESPTEASVTRFIAFYQTNAPDVVGPVRSARLMDVEVVPLHDAMLAYSGASIGVQDRLWEHGLTLLAVEGNAAAAGWRDNSRFAPHNLYTSIPLLRDVAENSGWMREAENEPFTYGDLPGGGLSGAGVTVPYAAGFVRFEYNDETDSYDRIVDGIPSRDVGTDQPVSPKNVVVMFAEFFVGDIAPNTRGEISNNVVLRGTGNAWVLRNGERYEAEWRRDELYEPFRYYDRETGEEIPLAEGNTWICLVPPEIIPEPVE